ncbi:MAG: hypothetical protein AAF654_03460 [Myxococcota bacterium]
MSDRKIPEVVASLIGARPLAQSMTEAILWVVDDDEDGEFDPAEHEDFIQLMDVFTRLGDLERRETSAIVARATSPQHRHCSSIYGVPHAMVLAALPPPISQSSAEGRVAAAELRLQAARFLERVDVRDDRHIGSRAEQALLEASAGRPFFSEGERRQLLRAIAEATSEDRCEDNR